MANLIPGVPRKNGGERRFAQRLVETLEDDYWAWHDVAVGRLQRRPDFVVLHPRRGLLVLEVKDWKIGTIHDFNKSSTTLLTDRGLVEAANPIRQARGILEYLCDMLERDPALVNPPGHSHAGKLAMPRGHGVVLANISRATFVGHGLDTIWPENLVICQDEMAEGVDAEAFQERLWNMFNYQFREPLTLPQIDRIRWHLYPEMRVHAPLQADLLSPPDSDPGTLPIPDIVRVMDRQQEQLARSLGDGHRIIHGVAGSGKTMILAYRCVHLARSLDRPILVLCFNRTLAARLAHAVDIQGLHSRVDVRSFHVWCASMLRTYHVPSPPNNGDAKAFFASLVEAVVRGVERGAIPRAQYGAVLIDEGHDFEPEWFRLVVQMIDPATNALLVLYDDAQSIYAAGTRRKFSFASVGIEARGRTTVLKLNYRNTYEVLAVARAFVNDVFGADDGDEDAPHAIAPESVGRHGPVPELARCPSLAAEAQMLAAQIADASADGRPLDRIAVLWRHGAHADAVARVLNRRGLPYRYAKDSRDKDSLFDGPPSVKLVSIHSSKGLEFEQVFIPAVHAFPGTDDDDAIEAKLLYVAMTRATERLVMTCSAETGFVARIDSAIDAAKRASA